MKAVIDEDLPRSLRKILSGLGFTVFDIRDYGLRGQTDEKVFFFAQKQKAVLFTADLGFANILRFPPRRHYGICILRFPNEMSTKKINQTVYVLLYKLSPKDYKGNLIILSPHRLRIRSSKCEASLP